MLSLLKVLEILMTFVAGFLAVGGETYRGAQMVWYRRITIRGWLAVLCLLFLLVLNLVSHVDASREMEREQQALAAEKATKNRALRIFRQNICWVIVADKGARERYDYFRSNDAPYLEGGKSGFEAVKKAQAHNSSVVEQIDAVGVIETERFIEDLERLLAKGVIRRNVNGSCPGIVAEHFG